MGADGKPVIEGNASNCLVLKNMFLAAAETDPNWDITIQEDVKNECQRFGTVLHCLHPHGRVREPLPRHPQSRLHRPGQDGELDIVGVFV